MVFCFFEEFFKIRSIINVLFFFLATIIDRALAEQLAKKVGSFNDFLRQQSPYEQQPMNVPRGSYGERMDDRQGFRRNDDDRFSRGRNMDDFSPRRSSYYDEDYRNF